MAKVNDMPKTMTLHDLADQCGYFVWDCEQHCNNGYGCSHEKNTDRETDNCTIHASCQDWACPIAYRYDDDEDRGGGDAIMALMDSGGE